MSGAKTIRNAFALLLSFIIAIGISACSPGKSAGSFVEVTDQLKRTIKVPAKPERIISSYTISTSLLIALGLQDKLVGIEINAADRPLYKRAAPELLKLPAVGSGKTLNIEECMRLKPDLVILPYRMGDFVTRLEKLGIPVIAVAPEDMPSLLDTIRLVGKAAGAEQKAAELVDYYNGKIAMVGDSLKGIGGKTVVYLAGSSPLTTCTGEMYQSYLIDMAGGVNASREIKKGYWANVSMEQVLKWDPEVILSVQYSAFKDEEILKGGLWQSARAVKNKQVFRFPSSLEPWDYPAPSAILGVLWLTDKLHPDKYGRDAFVKDAQGFYREFYKIEVTAGDLGV